MTSLLSSTSIGTEHELYVGQYTEANVKIAQAHQDFVMGFISMTPAKWAWGPGAPGIKQPIMSCYFLFWCVFGECRPAKMFRVALLILFSVSVSFCLVSPCHSIFGFAPLCDRVTCNNPNTVSDVLFSIFSSAA